jgi:hypothetical protein
MLDGQTLGGGAQLPIPMADLSRSGGGNLANARSQFGLVNEEQSWVSHAPLLFELLSITARPSALPSQLSNLKRRAFTETDRAQRVARSLAAVNAAQPTQLSASEWKRVVEADIEDQY